MGTGGTWRAVFRKHVLIPCTGEDVFSEPRNTKDERPLLKAIQTACQTSGYIRSGRHIRSRSALSHSAATSAPKVTSASATITLMSPLPFRTLHPLRSLHPLRPLHPFRERVSGKAPENPTVSSDGTRITDRLVEKSHRHVAPSGIGMSCGQAFIANSPTSTSI